MQKLRTICSPRGIPNCHRSKHNVKLRILTSFEQHESEYDMIAVQVDSEATIASIEQCVTVS